MVSRGALLIGLTGLLLFPMMSLASSPTEAHVVASYKDGAVTDMDVSASLFINERRLPTASPNDGSSVSAAMLRREAEAVAFNSIVARTADAAKFQLPPKAQESLKREESRLLYRIYFAERILPAIATAREEWLKGARAQYEKHQKEFRRPQSYWFRFIFAGDPVSTSGDFLRFERRIRQAEEKLGTGASFESVARELSDSRPEQDRGAVIGPLSEDVITSERLSVLRKLAAGQASAPFRTAKGFMILRLERTEPGSILPFEETTSVLVDRGYVRKFLPDAVVRSEIDRFAESNPVTLFENAMSFDPVVEDKPIAQCGAARVFNRDIFTSQYRKIYPDGAYEKKEAVAAARKLAEEGAMAEVARKELVPASPLYQRAFEEVREAYVAIAFAESQSVPSGTPLLKEYLLARDECQTRVLKSVDFRMAP